MRLILSILFSFCSLLAFAQNGDYVILPEEVVHEGDYFTAGGTVEISGLVKGDVYAFGAQIVVDGEVEGDVIACGGSISISGVVRGSCRLFGGQMEINGVVGKSVTAMGASLQVAPKSHIGNNLVFTGGLLDLSGTVGQNAMINASKARVGGRVLGNLKGSFGHLRLGSKAFIGGDVDYKSAKEAGVASGAEIRGKIVYKPSAMNGIFKGRWKEGLLIGTHFMGLIMNFLFSFVIGWVFLRFLTKRLNGALRILNENPWRAFWVGLLTVILVPIVALVLLITIVGFPFALALSAIGVLGFYSAKIFPILWLGNAIFPKMGLKKNSLMLYFVGLVLFFALVQIPVVGWIISIAFTLLGVGALLLSRTTRQARS
ncbi:MAG: hypothetical protein KR126chlam1_01239 [Chlamydiae bacterium]|nr:hypothetical protein [Chlamydiota bacterium]